MRAGKEHILVVEDEEDLAELIRYHIARAGYTVSIADSGEKAIKLATATGPDLVLLDRMLPGIKGIDVARALKSDPKTNDIPIIFCTIIDDMDSIIQGFQAGATDYVTKPFKIEELLERVKTHVGTKAAIDHLKNSEKNLREQNETRTRFFNIISHELINSFNGMGSISRLLMRHYDGFDDEKKRQIIQDIHMSAENGMNLLKNLLDWSRLQTGGIVCRPSTLDLSAIAFEVLFFMQPKARHKGIELKTMIKKDTLAYADMNMVEMVIRNLVSNAVKFTPEGGVVEIRSETEGSREKIMISDNGVGISDKSKPRLFRIDVRHSTPGTGNEMGSGLGLILCRDFIQKNRGTIEIDSSVGKGTTVSFTLASTREEWDRSGIDPA